MPYKIVPTSGGKANVVGPDGKPKNKKPMSRKRAAAYARALYANTKGE